MSDKTDAKSKLEDYAEVTLATPWVGLPNRGRSARFNRGNLAVQSAKQLSTLYDATCEARLPKGGFDKFVEQRSAVHKEYIRQDQTTKRWGMLASCLCVVSSAALLVFAPEGREVTSYVVGAVLIVIAAGAFGFSTARFTDGKRKAEVTRD